MARSRARKSPASQAPAAREPPAAAPARRDPRRLVYAAFDLGFALLYLLIMTQVAPTRHGGGRALFVALCLAVAGLGGAMLVRRRAAWRLAIALCGLLLGLEVVLLVLILSSAAYLAGVYGAFGRGAASVALAAAALSLQLIALLPAFQLKFLLTRAGRRAFGVAPRAGA